MAESPAQRDNSRAIGDAGGSMMCKEVCHLFFKMNEMVPSWVWVEALDFSRNPEDGRPARLSLGDITVARHKEEPEEHHTHTANTEKQDVHLPTSLRCVRCSSLPTSF